jgi:hypothetical protein
MVTLSNIPDCGLIQYSSAIMRGTTLVYEDRQFLERIDKIAYRTFPLPSNGMPSCQSMLRSSLRNRGA